MTTIKCLLLGTALALVPTVEAAVADDGDPGTSAQQPAAAPPAAPKPQNTVSRTILFPVLAAVPLFGAHVDLPPINPPGGGTIIPGGSTDTSFNGAALAGFEIDRDRWTFYVDGLWAGLSAERASPRVQVKSDVVYGVSTFGWRVYGDLLVTAGVRRMAVNLHAQVGDFPEVHRKPGVWDPLLGLLWRHAAGRSWVLQAILQGGGFGVGADVDISGALAADWRFANHFGLRLGYSVLHFKLSDTVLGKTLETTQTLHGPSVGLGIYFGKR